MQLSSSDTRASVLLAPYLPAAQDLHSVLPVSSWYLPNPQSLHEESTDEWSLVSIPKLPGRYYFLFGAPIDTSGVDPNDKEACAALYVQVRSELEASLRYLLEKRRTDPYESAMPRLAVEATWNFTRQAPTFPL